MNFNIDIAIVGAFLLLTLFVGFVSGRGVKNIGQYALGDRNFSTFTISATIIATWISGGIFSMAISETYENGLYFIIPLFGDALVFLVIGVFLAPRMGRFLGKLSVADLMGELYGKRSKLITAIVGILGCAGEIAIQFKVSSVLLQMLFGVSNLYAIFMSAFVVIFYATFGGIRSVTFTDLIQFFTFGTVIPIITLIIWGTFDNPETILYALSDNPMFDWKEVLDYTNPRFLTTVTLTLFFALPHMYPVLFQRISMAQNTQQVSRSFITAAVVCFVIEIVICIVGILLYSKDQTLQPDTLFAYMLNNYSYVGFKGMVVVGVMAMIMSTTDSYINSASILFSHDLCKSFGVIKPKNELLTSRIFSVFIGVVAFILALQSKTILELGMMVWSFYIPIVTVPLLAAILGFRTTGTSFMASTFGGLVAVLFWRIYCMDTGVDSVIPGMLANVIFFFGTHYLLEQKGGWTEIVKKDTNNSNKIFSKILKSFKDVNLKKLILITNPKHESTYPLLGFFAIVSVYSTMFTIDLNVREQYSQIINFLYHSVLILASIFLTYPVWPDRFKSKIFISTVWFFGLFYILIVSTGIQVIISNFGQFQLMVLLLSMVVLSIVVRWQIALPFIVLGLVFSVYLLKYLYSIPDISAKFINIKFKIGYLLLVIGSILFAFLKPKQEEQELVEAKVDILTEEVGSLDIELLKLKKQEGEYTKQIADLNEAVTHYSERVTDQAKEIERLGATAQKILNNVNHELRLPVGNVMNFSQMICEGLDKYTPDQLKDLSDEVYKNSTRLSSMILNMLDLAMLDVRKIN
ncbi:MAG TPA: hypothetical protein QKA08_05565, partial [Candidatus Megaira endosymbiont of Nemacystus decipiens]|nr:hypothetical protein [Candidatus Megaera endosymbiont of Nemacystus decipiens]